MMLASAFLTDQVPILIYNITFEAAKTMMANGKPIFYICTSTVESLYSLPPRRHLTKI